MIHSFNQQSLFEGNNSKIIGGVVLGIMASFGVLGIMSVSADLSFLDIFLNLNNNNDVFFYKLFAIIFAITPPYLVSLFYEAEQQRNSKNKIVYFSTQFLFTLMVSLVAAGFLLKILV